MPSDSPTAALSEGLARDVARARRLLAMRRADEREKGLVALAASQRALLDEIARVVPEELRKYIDSRVEIGTGQDAFILVLAIPGHAAIATRFARHGGTEWRQSTYPGPSADPLVAPGTASRWSVSPEEPAEVCFASTIAGALALAEITQEPTE